MKKVIESLLASIIIFLITIGIIGLIWSIQWLQQKIHCVKYFLI